jgi:hypothetical protein
MSTRMLFLSIFYCQFAGASAAIIQPLYTVPELSLMFNVTGPGTATGPPLSGMLGIVLLLMT